MKKICSRSLKLTIIGAFGIAFCHEPAGAARITGFPISLDYSGPYYGFNADPGWSNRSDGWFTNYFANFYGCTLGSHRTNSFTFSVIPNRDQTNQDSRINHYLAFRLGVQGSSSETLTVIANWGVSNQTIATMQGSGYPSSAAACKWSSFMLFVTNTNDLTLTFTYSTGDVSPHSNGVTNYGGVDYFCWEPATIVGVQPTVRFEKQFTNTPNSLGPFGEYGDKVKLSWVNNSESNPDYHATDTYKLEYTTNGLNGPYTRISWTNYTTPTYLDLTETRWIAYIDSHSKNMFFRLHRE